MTDMKRTSISDAAIGALWAFVLSGPVAMLAIIALTLSVHRNDGKHLSVIVMLAILFGVPTLVAMITFVMNRRKRA